MGPRLPLPFSAKNCSVLETRGARHFLSVPAGSNPGSREQSDAKTPLEESIQVLSKDFLLATQ